MRKMSPLGLVVLWMLMFSGARAQRNPTPSPSASPWMTLSGLPPLVTANGGQSGVFPDQTLAAYFDALNKTAGGTALLCDLQLSKDFRGICRTNIDLKASTNIDQAFANGSNTYAVNGVNTTGFFAIDFTAGQLLNNVAAKQVGQSRLPIFDGSFALFSPDNVTALLQSYIQSTGQPAFLWLNVEYAKFYEEHKINMTSYVLTALRTLSPTYVSCTEVALLRTARSRAANTNTTMIFKIPSVNATEPTTNQTYGSLLRNLTNIKTFASGILVPKELIWPVDSATSLLEPPTTLVRDAHAARLEVHAYNFANDIYPSSYNYSFDPIKEQLFFINGPGFAVDGVVTDFPTTASIAAECYASQAGRPKNETSGKGVRAPFKGKQVITHSGGDSGNYPGSTQLSLQSAIDIGADYIDCPVQITKDGVLICRQLPDLQATTDILQSPFASMARQISALQNSSGVFSFDLTWEQISTLKANIYSPQKDSLTYRNRVYDGQEKILTLSDFLNFTKNHPTVGVYIVLENAYILNGSLGLDMVGALVSTLKKEGLDNSSNLVIQSEDSSALRALKQALPSATLIFNLRRLQSEDATLTDSVLTQIKTFADGVSVPRKFISPSTPDFSILTGPTNVVETFHSHNLSVLVVFFRNEFVSLPVDFLADPTLELDTYVQYYGIDGIVTDFPGTAKSYMTNRCPGSSTRTRQQRGFVIPTIVPGNLLVSANLAPPPVGAPAAPLDISEPPPSPSFAITPASPPTQQDKSSALPPVSTGLLLAATAAAAALLLV